MKTTSYSEWYKAVQALQVKSGDEAKMKRYLGELWTMWEQGVTPTEASARLNSPS
jgi:hypothetical protein